jgi:hypothetical protein
MRRIVVALLLLLLVMPAVQAQDSEWMVVMYNPTDEDPVAGEFVIITDQGEEESIPVPEEVYAPVEESEGEYALGNLAISPDLRFVISTYAAVEDPTLPALPLMIYDRERETQSEVEMALEFPLIYSFLLSPDGSQIVVAYVGGEDAEAVTENSEITTGLMLVDLATGEVTAEVNIETINEETGADAEWALPSTWIEGEGIPFVPACFFCTNIDITRIWTWNPSDNTFTETERYYFPFGAQLAESGEVLIARLNPEYPLGEDDPNAYLPPSNVIEYYAPDADPREEGTVVFFDDARYPLGGSPWVADGRAFLTRKQGDEEAVLVFRDGSQQAFTLPEGPVVVTGTRDGALIVDEQGTIYDYRVVNGEIISTEAAELDFTEGYNLANIFVVYSTPIGASSGGKEFPSVPEPRDTAMLDFN